MCLSKTIGVGLSVCCLLWMSPASAQEEFDDEALEKATAACDHLVVMSRQHIIRTGQPYERTEKDERKLSQDCVDLFSQLNKRQAIALADCFLRSTLPESFEACVDDTSYVEPGWQGQAKPDSGINDDLITITGGGEVRKQEPSDRYDDMAKLAQDFDKSGKKSQADKPPANNNKSVFARACRKLLVLADKWDMDISEDKLGECESNLEGLGDKGRIFAECLDVAENENEMTECFISSGIMEE